MSGHNDREGTASFQATADRSCSPSHQLAVSSTPTSDPDRARTCDLRFRKPLLYPAELRDRWIAWYREVGGEQRGSGWVGEEAGGAWIGEFGG